MLDLDAIIKRVDMARDLVLHPDEEAAPLTVEEAVALVAELRAARDVINLLRPMVEGTPLPDGRATLAALAAYDKATGGGS